MSVSTSSSRAFPERLRAARELRELSQSQLANKAGLQASAISHFETGTRKPSFENLRRLAIALDVTTDFLLGRTNEPSGLGAPDELHRHWERLSDEDRRAALAMLEVLAKRASSKSRR
jgi:transcriptional regulator with XRE-family HTH domain